MISREEAEALDADSVSAALMSRLSSPRRYDLDCKSDNLSKHVSDLLTSAEQSAFMEASRVCCRTISAHRSHLRPLWLWLPPPPFPPSSPRSRHEQEQHSSCVSLFSHNLISCL